jgi:hypothetical protein
MALAVFAEGLDLLLVSAGEDIRDEGGRATGHLNSQFMIVLQKHDRANVFKTDRRGGSKFIEGGLAQDSVVSSACLAIVLVIPILDVLVFGTWMNITCISCLSICLHDTDSSVTLRVLSPEMVLYHVFRGTTLPPFWLSPYPGSEKIKRAKRRSNLGHRASATRSAVNFHMVTVTRRL